MLGRVEGLGLGFCPKALKTILGFLGKFWAAAAMVWDLTLRVPEP